MTIEQHKDPGWWRRNEVATLISDSDFCNQCGHIRGLHGTVGCLALSGAIVGRPGRCACTQGSMDGVWHSTRGLAIKP
jgi:hypothetical protein